MMGLDYTWWHGMYDVPMVFYIQFIPEAKALDPNVVDDVIGNMPEHQWFTKRDSPEQAKKIHEYYKTRCGE